MLTVHVTHADQTITRLEVVGHTDPEDRKMEPEEWLLAVKACASASGIVGMTRMLLGGTPFQTGGGDYRVDVQAAGQFIAHGAVKAFEHLARVAPDGTIRIEHVNA